MDAHHHYTAGLSAKEIGIRKMNMVFAPLKLSLMGDIDINQRITPMLLGMRKGSYWCCESVVWGSKARFPGPTI